MSYGNYDDWKLSNPYDEADEAERRLADFEAEEEYADMMENQRKIDAREEEKTKNNE